MTAVGDQITAVTAVAVGDQTTAPTAVGAKTSLCLLEVTKLLL